MNWPVQIIPPADKAPGIKWSNWFFSFIGILLTLVVSWVGAKIASPTEENALLKLLTLLFFWCRLLFLSLFPLGPITMVCVCRHSKQESAKQH